MKYLFKYKLFESESEYDRLMGKMLHVYGSIPLPKEKSSVVIKKIILSTRDKFFEVGENININHYKLHDKVRFKDYFDSLLNSKDTRGFNFEGFLAGVFGGELSSRGARHDLTIQGKNYSVKFVDNPSQGPELGSYGFLENIDDDDEIPDNGGLTWIFRGNDRYLKKWIWKEISYGVDAWIIAYPDKKENPTTIVLNIIPADDMYNILSSRNIGPTSPKGGLKKIYSLALSPKYKKYKNLNTSYISIPELTIDELKRVSNTTEEESWGAKVFGGVMSSKIRPDVLRYIRRNKSEIIKKLNEF